MSAKELGAECGILLVAAGLWFVHPSIGFLNGPYALGFYPGIQHAFTSWTNVLPFAVGDVFIVFIFGTVLALWIRSVRQSHSAAVLARLVLRTAAIAALLYAWFLIAWGWNYSRDPLWRTLRYDAAYLRQIPLDREEAALVNALNSLAPFAHAEHDQAAAPVAPIVATSYRSVLPALGYFGDVELTHPKVTMLDPYFVATGVSGMFFPFTFETYITSDVLWFEYPFNLAHEWAHLAGIARESDANFVGAITTLRSSDPVLRYSGLILVYAAMPRLQKYDNRLSATVQADYQEMRDRNTRHIKKPAFTFAWKTYDRYLKSQHVETGVVNYSEYVSLLLGTTLGRDALAAAIGTLSP